MKLYNIFLFSLLPLITASQQFTDVPLDESRENVWTIDIKEDLDALQEHILKKSSMVTTVTFIQTPLSDSLILGLDRIPDITELVLSSDNLKRILDLGAGNNVLGLRLKGGETMAIDSRIFNLKQLKYVSIAGHSFPVQIRIPENHLIEKFGLSHPAFQELPKSIEQLKALREISLGTNNFQSLPTNVNLEKLTRLSINAMPTDSTVNIEIKSELSDNFPRCA